MDESTVQSGGMLFQVTAMYMREWSETWYHVRCLIDNCVMRLVATCGHPDCAMKAAFDHLLMHPEVRRGDLN